MCNFIKKSWHIVAFSLVFVSLLASSGAAWQDDPFNPFDTGGADSSAVGGRGDFADIDLDESLSEGVKLVIRSVRESNPTTPVELSRAIKSMVNIRQYDEAKKYLIQLVALKMDGPRIFDLSQSMGADFFIDLKTTPGMQPEGGEFADLVFSTSKREAYSPARIADLIGELSDDNKFVRNDAFRKLRTLGAPAVAVMLEVCENEKRRREVPFLQNALKQMGEPALMPLIGAVRADSTVAQAVAVGALSSIENQLAFDALLRASVSSFVPQSVRAIASEAVSRQGYTSQEEIKQAINDRANEYLNGNVAIDADGRGNSTIWNWDFNKEKLISTQLSAENAVRIMGVDLARDVFRLEPSNNDYRQLLLLSVVDATKRVLGPHRFILSDEVKTFLPDLNAGDLNQAIETAMQRQMTPAAVGASELMGQIGDSGVLLTADGSNSPLVKAVMSGNRELQYAACKAISQIDPQQAFPGCSYVGKVVALMANTDGRSTGVAVHPRTDLAQALASSIYQSGSIGLTANSGQGLFEMLNSNPDIEFLLITDTLARPHYQELVQQLRSYWLSKNLPIALLVRNEARERQAELIMDSDPMTIVLPLTSNPKRVFEQISQLRDLRPNVVADTQRNQHAAFAMRWIASLLDQPESYRFYHLSAYRDQMVDLVKIPADYELKSRILARLGTPNAQTTLVNLASDSALAPKDRSIAASAFADSVAKFGVMLGRAQIQAQYDRYNASEFQPVEVQKILSSILDTIEARLRRAAGKTAGNGASSR